MEIKELDVDSAAILMSLTAITVTARHMYIDTQGH
jgi:hypothetical protein